MKKSLLLFASLFFAAGAMLFAQTTVTYSFTGSIQTFTVPACVNSISVEARGAQGGFGTSSNQGGLGAQIIGTFAVNPGDVITILVGQRGGTTGNSGGGGGGSFVYNQTTSTLMVAAGGGGGGGNSTNGMPGQAGTSGTNGVGGSSSATGGSGGGGGGGASGYGGGGGGGYCGNGGNCALTYSTGGVGGVGCNNGTNGNGTVCNGTGGVSFLNGGAGGTWAPSGCAGGGADGGYGGGGATVWGNFNGGGGGGYSGGGGGGYNASFDGGGGGGSFNSGTSQSNVTGFQSGNGIVNISYSPGIPAAAGSISGSAAVCAGDMGTYSISSVSGATNYTWVVPAGATINSGQGTTSISVTFGSTSGNVTVTPSNTCGSGTSASLSVTVTGLPVVTTSASATTICSGNSTTITASGATTYTWMPGNLTGTSVTVSPSSTTTYTVTGTTSGCNGTTTQLITVDPTPTVAITATNSTICSGDSTSLTASGATTYAWMPGNLSGSSVTVAPGSTTTYTVTGTDAGCNNTATQLITVNPTPTVTATTANSSVCLGDSTTITAGGATSYTWMPGNLTGNSVTVAPGSTTTYTITGTDAGCNSTTTQLITVNNLPSVNLGNDVTQCGGTVLLDAQNSGSVYLWSDSATTQSISVSASGTYSVAVTDANGCIGSDTINVTIHALPTVSAVASPTTVCLGNPVALTASGATTYNWLPGNLSGSNVTITPTATGEWTVTGTDSNGCMNVDSVIITVNQLPALTLIASNFSPCANDGLVTLTGLPAGGTWSGTSVSGNSFNPATAGVGPEILTYTYTDSNGCTNSSVITINVNPCTGIDEESFENNVSFYPNPNEGIFTLAVNADVGEMEITIVDAQGRVVYTSTESNVTPGFTTVINLGDIASGFYLMKLSTATETQFGQLMIQH